MTAHMINETPRKDALEAMTDHIKVVRDDEETMDDDFKCPTCKGNGTVNPLSAPEGFFCVGTTDCPHCDGTGEI